MLLGSIFANTGRSVGLVVLHKMEMLMCAIHLRVGGVRVCCCGLLCVYCVCIIDRCSDSVLSSNLSEEEEETDCSDLRGAGKFQMSEYTVVCESLSFTLKVS